MTDTLTHALTIHQPWAWAVAAGHKPVENRTWRPPLEAVGKLIGIHAGLQRYFPGTKQWDEFMRAWNSDEDVPVEPLTVGALIGVARLVGVVRSRPDGFVRMLGASVGERIDVDLHNRIVPWWRGPWGWLLEEAVLLPEPIPMRGQQGLWRLPTIADRVTNLDERGQWQLDERKLTAADLALEQWRKARETR